MNVQTTPAVEVKHSSFDGTSAHDTGMQSFDYVTNSVSVRTELVDGEPWFVAKDVCDALGISWRGNETLAILPEAWTGVRSFRTPARPDGNGGGGEQQLIIISEAGMYKLAFRSNKPTADAFTNWVAGELLPSLRRTGRYEIERGVRNAYPISLPRRARILPRDREGWQTWADRITAVPLNR